LIGYQVRDQKGGVCTKIDQTLRCCARDLRRRNREEVEQSTVTQRHLNLEYTLVHWHTSNRVKTDHGPRSFISVNI